MAMIGTGWRTRRRPTVIAVGFALALVAPLAPASDWGAAFAAAWLRHPLSSGWTARSGVAAAAREIADGYAPEPASVALGLVDDRLGSARGRQEWELEFAVPMWLPGQRDARAAEAESHADETAAREALARWEVAGEVRETWWSLAQARSTVALAERRLETAIALASDVARRYEAGDVSRIDANLARSERLVAESELAEARLAVRQASGAWLLLTGVAPTQELPEEAPPASRIASGSDAYVGRHPQVVAAAALARSARARWTLADRSRRAAPELALRLVRERGEASEPFASRVGVKLTIPLSSPAQVRRDASVAVADVESTEAEMRKTAQRVASDMARAGWALDVAERQLVAARERQALAADSLRLSEKAFAVGEVDLPTLLRLRAAAYDADSQVERTRIARSAAISQLHQSSGVSP